MVNSSRQLLRKQWSALSLDNDNVQWQDTTTTTRSNAGRSATLTTQCVTGHTEMIYDNDAG